MSVSSSVEQTEIENIYSPEFIYGELFDEITEFLNTKMTTTMIMENCLSEFEPLIDRHIRNIWKTKPSPLTPFEDNLQWLNTSRPLYFDKDLGKKIYAMDFFTYCCINCIHILPYLKEVESKYDRPDFTVLGIHSPKFPNEKHLSRLEEAVQRNEIKHPVLNDSDCKLWKQYGITCWPTVFVVGPGHTLMFVLIGEIHIEKLSFLFDRLFHFFDGASKDVIDGCPIPKSSSLFMKSEATETNLLFPGNVSSNGDGDKIIVSDTGHNQLLLMSRALEVKEVIGNGIAGCKDGPFNIASFNSPHGTTWENNIVYVADTGNHSIRKVDFDAKVVSTIFANTDYLPDCHEKPIYEEKFLSPWDVCIGPELGSDLSTLNILYIAAAGSHQIWALDLKGKRNSEGYCVPFAGSGKEENRPNCYRLRAGFAQPSGISYSTQSPNHLFIADSESSTIKSIDLEKGAVKTIVGGGRDPTDLFQFGDEDGVYLDVKLQHPLSLCVLGKDSLAITDTYNHKIKFIRVEERMCDTVDAGIQLCEPSGICLFEENKLLVADTNNHRIVTINVVEDKAAADLVPFDGIVECLNLSPHESHKSSVVLACEGKIYCYFDICSNPRYEKSEGGSIMLNYITFSENGKLEDVVDESKTSWETQPFLVIKPAFTGSENFEETSCDMKLNVCLPICDKVLKVCSLEMKLFEVSVKFSSKGLKSVRLNLNAIID